MTRTLPASPDPEPAQLEGLVERCLHEATRLGASGAEAAVGAGSGLDVTVRLGALETIEHRRDKGLTVTVFVDGRTGAARTSAFDEASVLDTVRAAYRIASFAAPDPHAGLANPEDLCREVPDLGLDHPWSLTVADAERTALEAEDAARGRDPRITNSEGANVSTRRSVRVYGNTNGFLGHHAATRHAVSCAVIAQAGDSMQRDYWYAAARAPQGLPSPDAVGALAADRALRRLGARQPSTTHGPVLFAAEVAGGLIGHFLAAIAGGNLYRRASFLVDQLGRSVFPRGFLVEERPRLPGGAASAAFDNDGVATRDRALVEDGVLQSYLLGAYSARRLGLRTTGNAGGPRNVRVRPFGPGQEAGPTGEPGLRPPPALLETMGRGLYVTELIGMGVSTVTGDYSRGAAGFWVEDGRLGEPVEEITIAGNLRDMYAGVVAAGSDIDERGNVQTGSILIESMAVAGS